MKFRHAMLAASTIIGLATLIGCGGSAAKSTTPSSTPVTAETVLADAAQQFENLNSLHFDLQISGGVALDQNGTIKLKDASGDLLRPDSASAKASVTFLGTNLSISLISIGGDQYITNPVSGNWEKAPSNLGYNPAVLFDNGQGIGQVVKTLQSPEIVGSQTINGKDTYHIKGTVTQQSIQPIAGGAISANAIPVEIWVEKQSNNVVKLTIHDSGASGGNSENTWTLLLTQQNKPVTIQKPNV